MHDPVYELPRTLSMRSSQNSPSTTFVNEGKKEGRDRLETPAPLIEAGLLLLPPRPPICRLPCLAHRLHALLGAEQHGGLGRTEMTGGDGGQDDGRSGALVWGLVDDQHIVLAEAVVEREQPTTHALRQPAKGFAAVLRVLGKRGPGLGGVGNLRHVEGHGLTSSFLPPTTGGITLSTDKHDATNRTLGRTSENSTSTTLVNRGKNEGRSVKE